MSFDSAAHSYLLFVVVKMSVCNCKLHIWVTYHVCLTYLRLHVSPQLHSSATMLYLASYKRLWSLLHSVTIEISCCHRYCEDCSVLNLSCKSWLCAKCILGWTKGTTIGEWSFEKMSQKYLMFLDLFGHCRVVVASQFKITLFWLRAL